MATRSALGARGVESALERYSTVPFTLLGLTVAKLTSGYISRVTQGANGNCAVLYLDVPRIRVNTRKTVATSVNKVWREALVVARDPCC